MGDDPIFEDAMGLIFRLEESDFSGYIDDGTECLAQVLDISLREKPFIDEATKERVKRVNFKFQLISDSDDDLHDRLVWGDTPTTFNTNPKCRLRNWTESILGQRLPVNFDLDTDVLLNRRCWVVIGKRFWQKDGEEKEGNFVRDVHPTREARAALEAAPSYEDEPF